MTRRESHNIQILTQGGTPSLTDSLTTPKIIVAEDDELMRKLIASRFRQAGYDVVEMGDGEVLWAELRQCILDEDNPREPDLIVSDVRMPGRTGLEVLSLIRQTDWATPVILITAFGEKALHDEAYRLGAAHVFNKPLDVKELVATAVQIVGPVEGVRPGDRRASEKIGEGADE